MPLGVIALVICCERNKATIQQTGHQITHAIDYEKESFRNHFEAGESLPPRVRDFFGFFTTFTMSVFRFFFDSMLLMAFAR